MPRLTRSQVQVWKRVKGPWEAIPRARAVTSPFRAFIRALPAQRGHPVAAAPCRGGEFAYLTPLMVKPWGPMFSCTPCWTAYKLMMTPLWFCIFRPATPPARVTPAPTAA
jgi:hypothetical protein